MIPLPDIRHDLMPGLIGMEPECEFCEPIRAELAVILVQLLARSFAIIKKEAFQIDTSDLNVELN